MKYFVHSPDGWDEFEDADMAEEHIRTLMDNYCVQDDITVIFGSIVEIEVKPKLVMPKE